MDALKAKYKVDDDISEETIYHNQYSKEEE